ncbi:MAG: sensor histidine kinase [Christensenellales bacterium]
MLDKQDSAYILHEIKTPVSVISGYAQLALQCGNRDETLFRRALQSIIDETGNILWIIQAMQSITELEHSKPEKINIAKMVEESIREYAGLFSDRVWQLDCEQEIFVHISFLGIKGAIRNLFDNAVKYTLQGGLIKTEVFLKDQYAVIRVIDNGIGIPEKDISHVFDLRFRASNTKNIYGSGIGLFLVKKIVESSHGMVEVESMPYKGSKFIISLPRAN